ncbi:MAG: hypothetical protein WEB05_01665 [Solirubrobacterales bacterium]
MIRWVVIFAVVLIAAGALFFGIRTGDDGSGDGGNGSPAGSAPDRPQPVLTESSCPPDLSNCVVASGRVIYVEAVDPDGDGDAHLITESQEGVSASGVTIFDVRSDLRPDPLPEVGDLVGGAGPVFRGSYGQKQIEVVEFHVAR